MTFKVNWEKTSVRIELPQELILKMLGTYYTDASDIKSIAVLEGGCANINVLVHFNSSSTIILRVYIRDKGSAYVEQKISSLLHGKMPVAQFYHVAEYGDYTFAIMEYLPGQSLRDVLLNGSKTDIMLQVGRMLGEIASIKFPEAGFFNKELEVVERTTQEGLLSFCFECLANKKVKMLLPQKQRDQIENIFRGYKNLLPDDVERNLVHADFDPANILVTESNGHMEVSGILDWEFSFAGSTLYDVANMLRYAHHMPEEYQRSFLQGLCAGGYVLPGSWQITVHLLNIISLLDCLTRSDELSRPAQTKDIKDLLSHILDVFNKVDVVPYDKDWTKVFAAEAEKIKNALWESFVAIHHVGSTAVPGLAAKPTIDIIACVDDFNFDCQGLEDLNYEYRGGFGLPFRKSFTYRSCDLNVNLHVFDKDDPEVELNLLFRDYLRDNPAVREQYAALKYKLLADESSHQKNGKMYRGYTLGKHDLIQDILRKAGFDRVRMVICSHYAELDAAKKFRSQYFKKEDHYSDTFNYNEHKHFILYQGVEIIGYAHLHLCPEDRAILRFISIAENRRDKGYGKEFMNLIEKWLRLSGYKIMHATSLPELREFYQAMGYVEMPPNDASHISMRKWL